MDITVGQLINRKGDAIWATQPDATVFEALALMARKEVGALLVMQGNQLVGIFSERDYARKVILAGKSSHGTRVSEIMTTNVLCVRPDQTMADCMALMTNKRVRHLPVLDHRVFLPLWFSRPLPLNWQ